MQSAISVSGTIRNIKDGMGSTIYSALSEAIDNSMDASGGKPVAIKFIVDYKNREIISVDNAAGMNKKGLEKSTCIFDRKEAVADDKQQQGKYGGGQPAYLLQFSEGKSTTTTLTKQRDGELLQVEQDWPGAIKNNEYRPFPHEASVTCSKLWEKIAIDPKQGTACIVPCTPEKFAHLDQMICNGKILDTFGKMYAQPLAYGLLKISFLCLGADEDATPTEFCVKPIDVLGYADEAVQEKYKQTAKLLCYELENAEKIKVITTYLKADDGQLSKYEFPSSGKPAKLIKCDLPENSILIGEGTIQSVVDLVEKTNNSAKGGIYIARNTKLIGTEPHSRNYAAGGDYSERNTRDVKTRSIFTFGADLDNYTKTEVNKSRLVFGNMEENLRKTLEEVHYNFSKKIYDNYHPYAVKKAANNQAATAATAAAKARAAADKAAADLTTVVADSARLTEQAQAGLGVVEKKKLDEMAKAVTKAKNEADKKAAIVSMKIEAAEAAAAAAAKVGGGVVLPKKKTATTARAAAAEVAATAAEEAYNKMIGKETLLNWLADREAEASADVVLAQLKQFLSA
jgi:hypothetical protein